MLTQGGGQPFAVQGGRPELEHQVAEPSDGELHGLLERSIDRSACGSSIRRRSVSTRMPTAVIFWIVSSWMSDAMRCRSSS